MTLNKIILLSIFVSSIVCETVEKDHPIVLTRSMILGVWYHLGVTSTFENSNIITCYITNVTKESGYQQNFKQVSRYMMHGEPQQHDAHGQIINCEAHITYAFAINKFVYTVTTYNNAQYIILHDKMNPSTMALMSRGTTLSPEMKKQFETMARLNGNKEAVYYNQVGCSY